ncbi:DUF3857 domain-containing protein [Porphyromonadaceae bacterium OttesenSCG-928-L07]|nr:DUF3857 domain-containing protein [Porphyromonadaceae bacterium OttesenSCG-928-L07]MDL2251795.1 DUF3857 domain-containing protein [Odoribacter sp. OttesenSCG-928-J03]MDL2330860.1 DUF3857 domain-containing protein [Odoribacter sp. OttesenSCG-928-A06]
MKSFTLILLLLFVYDLSAQKGLKHVYGKITKEELEMTEYPLDTTAVAVVFLDMGETSYTIDQNGSFIQETSSKVKIKILKDEGLEWCNQELLYYEKSNSYKEEVSEISGTTYNLEDGKIVKTALSKEYIFDESINQRYRVKKFTMPAAKVGSVIEYKSKISSTYYLNLRSFTFQQSIPVVHASYTISVPEMFRFNIQMNGYEPIATKKSDEVKYFTIYGQEIPVRMETTTFTGSNLPALKNEGYLWSIDDYTASVSFELRRIEYPNGKVKDFGSTWSSVDKTLLELSDFGANLNKPGIFRKDSLPEGVSLENAQAILKKIKQKVKWNKKGGIYASDIKGVWQTGVGGRAEMNFLLINALKVAGFDAFPLLVRSRSRGVIRQTNPSADVFDRLVVGVHVDDNDYFTDASEIFGAWNVLPEECLVTNARKVSPEESGWVDLSVVSLATEQMSATYSFVDGVSNWNISTVLKGNAAYDFRNKYVDSYKEDKEKLKENWTAGLDGVVENFTLENEQEEGKDLKISYAVKGEKGSELPDYLYLTLFSQKQNSENPFKSEKRTLPINFGCLKNQTQFITLEIPEGYVVDELPASVMYVFDEENSITFLYRIAQSGNRVILRWQLVVRRLLFLPDEYEILREYYAKVVSKNLEQVVLKKASVE